MAQTTILAVGSTEADSTAAVCTVGGTITVGLYNTAGSQLSPDAQAAVYITAPSGSRVVGFIKGNEPPFAISSAGSYFVRRIPTGVSFGVFLES